MYLVNLCRLRRLARSWWSTCARSPRWTKKRAVTMKKLLLTGIAALLFLTTGAVRADPAIPDGIFSLGPHTRAGLHGSSETSSNAGHLGPEMKGVSSGLT
jgi:hypothetical protein